MFLRFAAAVSVFATVVSAQDAVPIQRVVTDAIVIDRVAEASRKDLPVALLKRIVNEDVDLLRGKRSDGSFQYATHERLEASRESKSFSIQPRKEGDFEKSEIRGAWVYRVLLHSPSRRMVVTKNRKVYVDRVELEYVPQTGTTTQSQVVKIDAWLEPGELRPIDFPVVARQGTARAFSRADGDKGYGNIVLTMVQAKVIDNADSPYVDAVASLKAIQRAVEGGEVPSIRAMATRIQQTLGANPRMTASAQPVPAGQTPVAPVTTGGSGSSSVMNVTAAPDPAANASLHKELQELEDLLTGNESERRQGLDRLHQLVRKYRP